MNATPLIEAAAGQKDRVFLWTPVFLGLGVALYFGLKQEPPLWAGLLAVAMGCGAALILWPRHLNSRIHYISWLVLLALLLCACGFSIAKIRTMLVATPLLPERIGPVVVEGTIKNLEILDEGQGYRVILSDLSIEDVAPEKTPRLIRLKMRNKGEAEPGDRIRVLAGLNPPGAPVAPDAFDFQRFAYFKKIGAFGFTFKAPEVVQKSDHPAGLWLENLRQEVGKRIHETMASRPAGITNALMTGERAAMVEEDVAALRASGLFHIISISGLHIGMIAGAIFFMTRLIMAAIPSFALYHPIKKYAAILALVGIVLYMLMVGMTVPTVRSVIMTGIILIAVMLDRIPVSLRLVAIAALFILVFAPDALLGASFQMSFAAVTGLVAFYEATRTYWANIYKNSRWLKRGFLYLAGVCLTTLIAGTMTAPFGLYHFQQYAVYSVLANLAAVPLTAFVIMPAILLAYILMPLGLDMPALWAAGKGIDGMLWVAHKTAALPYAVLTPPSWPLSALFLMILAMLFLCLTNGRLFRALAVIPFIAALVVIGLWQQPDILVSGNAKLMALRMMDGQVLVSNARAEKFSAEAWTRLLGRGIEKPEVFPKEGRLNDLICDSQACRIERDSRKVSLAFHPSVHAQECEWADILVADDPVRNESCKSSVVIDRFDLWREGAHAVWIERQKSLSVLDQRGQRPWVNKKDQ